MDIFYGYDGHNFLMQTLTTINEISMKTVHLIVNSLF